MVPRNYKNEKKLLFNYNFSYDRETNRVTQPTEEEDR